MLLLLTKLHCSMHSHCMKIFPYITSGNQLIGLAFPFIEEVELIILIPNISTTGLFTIEAYNVIAHVKR